MIIAELPPDEELRLADLASYDIMNTHAEDDFDELVELAGQICKTPISLITLLDKERQWFKAKKGLAADSTSKDVAFCAHAILEDTVMKVEDAREDIRFFDNPLVTGDLNIRFYAGAPIVSPNGHNLGTICIIDNKPKKLNATEERALLLLSKQVTKLLELRKKNKLIRERAEEMIALKSETIDRVIKVQEEDKKAIALSLHEDLAQSLASSIVYLKLAVENEAKRLPLLLTVKNQLEDILDNMKNLSNSITPSMLNWITAEDLIAEFIEKTAITYPYNIQLSVKGHKSNGPADKALVVIRVIEEWLKILGEKKYISLVNITIIPGEPFDLQFENDGPLLSFDGVKKEIFAGLMFDRIRSIGGTLDLSASSEGNTFLKISLPLFNNKMITTEAKRKLSS